MLARLAQRLERLNTQQRRGLAVAGGGVALSVAALLFLKGGSEGGPLGGPAPTPTMPPGDLTLEFSVSLGSASTRQKQVQAKVNDVITLRARIVNNTPRPLKNARVQIELPGNASGGILSARLSFAAEQVSDLVQTAQVKVPDPAPHDLEYVRDTAWMVRGTGARERIEALGSGSTVLIADIPPGPQSAIGLELTSRVKLGGGGRFAVDMTGINNTHPGPDWSKSVAADPGEVVQFRLVLQNAVVATVARNVRVRVTLPPATEASPAPAARVTIASDNTDAASGQLAVTLLSGEQGFQYIPGTATVASKTCPAGCSAPDTLVTSGLAIGDLAYGDPMQLTFMAHVTNVVRRGTQA